ncbi:hypothetical protein A2J03_24360 [Rhodococcus sp. EPR-157]|uniref:DUF5313 family protein n=1 Tax=Rhodococcus sp. EPR-157 TaxID=1813677 RepID=UPI0007BBBBD1|nr:DUF5313 family protein [Rhodococcus sp. EPR-157]KZF06527.1 hypothetical protein A2J03_24360 [Rhodococcus sp. EPR-157]
MTDRTRPNAAQWLGYVLGRKLPMSMQDWVRNDLVGKGAVPRHLLRSMIPFMPIFIGFLVLFPGALWLRGAMVLLSVLLALFYTVAFMELNRARRLELHGLPSNLKSDRKRAALDSERVRYEQLHLADRPPR